MIDLRAIGLLTRPESVPLGGSVSPRKTFLLTTRRTLVAARNEAILSPWTSRQPVKCFWVVSNSARPTPTVVTISVEQSRIETTLQPSIGSMKNGEWLRVCASVCGCMRLSSKHGVRLRKIGRVSWRFPKKSVLNCELLTDLSLPAN